MPEQNSPEAGALLEIDRLDVSYGRIPRRKDVIRDVSFTVARGESIGLIGETGSGKSTIARAVLGLVPARSGSVRIGGAEVTGLRGAGLRSFRRRGVVQYVFQDPLRSLDPDLTVGRSLAEPLLIRGVRSAQARERVRTQAEHVNLDPGLLDRLPAELSGGQRQRAAVARGLIAEPELLILDEPVSALDSANRVRVLQLLQGLRVDGLALMFISHDLGSVAHVAERTLVLHRGRIVEDGPTERIITDPQHPYTRLLIGSAPTLAGGAMDRHERARLRAQLAA